MKKKGRKRERERERSRDLDVKFFKNTYGEEGRGNSCGTAGDLCASRFSGIREATPFAGGEDGEMRGKEDARGELFLFSFFFFFFLLIQTRSCNIDRLVSR